MKFPIACALIFAAFLAPASRSTEPVTPPAAEADSKKSDPTPSLAPVAPKPAGCLPSGNGFLRARIRGALNLDVNWHNPELECEGAARPDGTGIRLSFAGPIHSDGRRLRMVFGVTDAAEGTAGNALPTNLTVIFEGEKRLFSTRGDNRCTVDKLSQERVGALGGPTRSYRVVARGFCIEPVSALSAEERIVVSSFDFAGHVVFTDSGTKMSPPPAATPTSAPR
ncbi:MAG: hypothetical protein ABI885_00720 [Gammaproteobacteria bacterium]